MSCVVGEFYVLVDTVSHCQGKALNWVNGSEKAYWKFLVFCALSRQWMDICLVRGAGLAYSKTNSNGVCCRQYSHQGYHEAMANTRITI